MGGANIASSVDCIDSRASLGVGVGGVLLISIPEVE
jgi:hypothetical protein